MNVNSKIKEKFREKKQKSRNLVGLNPLNLSIPRKITISGHFRLNTVHFPDGLLKVAVRN